jgi:hypothetical protein
MRRIDLGVFDPADRTPDGSLDGERRRRDNEIGDLVSLATFLGPELHRPGGGQRAAGVMKQWADGDAALLAEAETIAHREHHEEAAEILHNAHDLATF